MVLMAGIWRCYIKTKTNIPALEEVGNSEMRNYERDHTEIDICILQQKMWTTG